MKSFSRLWVYVPAVTLALGLAGCTGAPSTAQLPDPPDEDVQTTPELTLISRTPRSEVQALGGPNKPNGLQYRYRRSVPAGTPAYVPRQLESLELAIADETPDGWLAFYESTGGSLGPNKSFRAVLFGPGGSRLWDLNLNDFLSRPDQLEIQDIRYQDGHLYFNEACQTYARDAGGDCSALVSVDPETGIVDWRTGDLVSNDIFIFYGPYVVAGYGFTDEEDYLNLISRTTGEVVEQVPLDSAHDYLGIEGQMLRVVTYGSIYQFRLPSLGLPQD